MSNFEVFPGPSGIVVPYVVLRSNVPAFEPFAEVHEHYSPRDISRGAFTMLRRVASDAEVSFQFVSSVGINDPKVLTNNIPESFYNAQLPNYDGGDVRYTRSLVQLELGLPYKVPTTIDLFEEPHEDRGYARFAFNNVNDMRVVRESPVSQWVRPRESATHTYQHLAQQTASLLRHKGVLETGFAYTGRRSSFDPDLIATNSEL